jgi:hypothetical protein
MIQKLKIKQFAFVLLLSIKLLNVLQAQDWKKDNRINVVFGLTQPLLVKGFNIEGNYIKNRIIFDYSHGVSLDFTGSALPENLKSQNLSVHEPWTTGFGVGYRLTDWINVRIEPKWHKFEFYYDNLPQITNNKITSFITSTLGVGVYGSWQPFKKKQNILKGFLIAPSIRYWPTIYSSLKNDAFTYTNTITQKVETIKNLDPGFGFTPLIFNISIGYSFDLKK